MKGGEREGMNNGQARFVIGIGSMGCAAAGERDQGPRNKRGSMSMTRKRELERRKVVVRGGGGGERDKERDDL